MGGLILAKSAVAITQDNINLLQKSSQDIKRYIDEPLVVESLYNQMRNRAKVTLLALNKEQIDHKVRMYISEQYMPAMTSSYIHIYSLLKDHKSLFLDCSEIEKIAKVKNSQKMLCTSKVEKGINVNYMNTGYDNSWSLSSTFKFAIAEYKMILIGVELPFKEGVEVYVEGI
jgi:hypothetical protein